MKQLKSLVATSTKSRSLSACAAIASIVTQLSPPAKPAWWSNRLPQYIAGTRSHDSAAMRTCCWR